MSNVIIYPGGNIVQWSTGSAGGSYLDPNSLALSGNHGSNIIVCHNDFGITGSLYINGANKAGQWDDAYNNTITSVSFDAGNGLLTLYQRDGGNFTRDLDGRWLLPTLDHADFYVKADLDIPTGWYTVATNVGTRAGARFILTDIDSGRHSYFVFYASINYGRNATIDVINGTSYGNVVTSEVRVLRGSTYDGALLQVNVTSPLNKLEVYMAGDNTQVNGWTLTPWVSGDIDPGGVNNFANLTSTGSIVNLRLLHNGGASWQGPIYAGIQENQATQATNLARYEVFHSGNVGGQILTDLQAVEDSVTVLESDVSALDSDLSEAYKDLYHIGYVDNYNFSVIHPSGGFYQDYFTHGYIQIQLPTNTSFNNTMLSMHVSVTEYMGNKGTAHYHLFGYNYTGNSSPPTGYWVNTNCTTIANASYTGAYKKLTFGHKDGRDTIWIGNSSGYSWDYPVITINSVKGAALGGVQAARNFKTGDYIVTITTGEPESLMTINSTSIVQPEETIPYINVYPYLNNAGASDITGLRILDNSTTTNPRLVVGRSNTESFNVHVDDNNVRLYLKQDELVASHNFHSEIWSDSPGPNHFYWRILDSDGTSSVVGMTLLTGHLTLESSITSKGPVYKNTNQELASIAELAATSGNILDQIAAAGYVGSSTLNSSISTVSGHLQSEINSLTVDDLFDAVITSPTTNDLLSYQGGQWSNIPLIDISHASLGDLAAGDPHTQYSLKTATTGISGFLQSQIDGKANTSHFHSFASLSDTNFTAPNTDELAMFDGSEWVNTPLIDISHNSLGDLTAGDPHTQYALKTLLTSTSGHLSSSISSLSIDDLTDVVLLDTPNNGEVLTFNGESWSNGPLPNTVTLVYDDFIDNTGIANYDSDSWITIFNYNVPAGTLGTKNRVEYGIYGHFEQFTAASPVLAVRVQYNGQTLIYGNANLTTSTSLFGAFSVEGCLYSKGTTSSQGGYVNVKFGAQGNQINTIGNLNQVPQRIDQVLLSSGLSESSTSAADLTVELKIFGSALSNYGFTQDYSWARIHKERT